MSTTVKYTIGLIVGILALLLANVYYGSVHIPLSDVTDILTGSTKQSKSWQYIVWNVRFTQTITALFTGAGLSVAGLLMQTTFRNPLADPSILGISSGASLGAAIVILILGGTSESIGGLLSSSLSSSFAVIVGAFIGASLILSVIIAFASIVKNNVMLLIIGILTGYLTSSVITLLNFWSNSEKVFSFILWGMGNFSGVAKDQLPFYIGIVVIAIVISVALIKPMNALLLGEKYATNLGVKIKHVRLLLLICAGLITAVTTAYCGPIAFIGLAVPHIARLLLGTSNHNSLLPLTILFGSFLALLCNLFCNVLVESSIIPLNAVTPIFGAPIIIYVIINNKRMHYFK